LFVGIADTSRSVKLKLDGVSCKDAKRSSKLF